VSVQTPIRREALPWPADDARGRRGPGSADCLVPGLPSSQVEPDPAGQAQRYGAETTIPDRHKRLVCGQCGSHNVEMVADRWGEAIAWV
jgi:hypothetical protein